MSVLTRNNIVTNGLVLNLDTLNPQSIPLDPTANLILNPLPTSTASFAIEPSNSPFNSFHSMSYSSASQSLSAEITHPESWGWYVKNTSLANYFFDTNVSYSFSFEWKIGENTSLYNGSYFFNIVQNNGANPVSNNYTLKTSGSAGYTIGTLLPDGFYRITGSFKPNNSGSNSTMGYRIQGNSFPTGSQRVHFYWRNLQFEKLNYNSPFVSGSRTTWSDLSGNNNNATLISASITSSLPDYNFLNERILNFDGTGSYAVIPNNNNLVFGSGDFTVSIWIKTPLASTGEGSPSQWGPIVSKGCTTSAPAGTWWFAQTSTVSNSITFNISSTTGGTFVCSLQTTVLSDGWHNIVATRSGSTSFLYQNGSLVRTDTTSDSNLASTSSLFIGTNATSSTKYTSMGLSQVSLYNRALLQNEIAQNYNAIKTRFGLT